MDYNYLKAKLNKFVLNNAQEWEFVSMQYVVVPQVIILKIAVVLKQNIKPTYYNLNPYSKKFWIMM